MSESEFITTKEAARRLGVTVCRINQYCRSGRMGRRAPGGRLWIITAAEVAAFCKRPAGNPQFGPNFQKTFRKS